MSKTTAALYGLLSGGLAMSVLAGLLWMILIIGVLFTIPTGVRAMRARLSSDDGPIKHDVEDVAA